MSYTCPHGCKNGKIFMESTKSLVNCPLHGATVQNLVKLRDEHDDTITSRLLIPQEYVTSSLGIVDKMFDSSKMALSNYSEESVEELKSVLNAILIGVAEQELIKCSYYIQAPSTILDLDKVVYATQVQAIKSNVTTVPYISANTLNSLIRCSDSKIDSMDDLRALDSDKVVQDSIDALDGLRFIKEHRLSYYDYVKSDLCFIYMTANTKDRGWYAVADLLQERARHGLPTYVIGYWGSKAKECKQLKYIPTSGLRGLKVVECAYGIKISSPVKPDAVKVGNNNNSNVGVDFSKFKL